MLRSSPRLSASLTILVSAFVLAGCQSTTAPTTQMSSTPPPAVIAGKTTFVNVSGGQGPPILVAYTDSGKAPCPECEAVAEKYFSTGVLDEHVCKTCGANINVGQGQVVQPK